MYNIWKFLITFNEIQCPRFATWKISCVSKDPAMSVLNLIITSHVKELRIKPQRFFVVARRLNFVFLKNFTNQIWITNTQSPSNDYKRIFFNSRLMCNRMRADMKRGCKRQAERFFLKQSYYRAQQWNWNSNTKVRSRRISPLIAEIPTTKL